LGIVQAAKAVERGAARSICGNKQLVGTGSS